MSWSRRLVCVGVLTVSGCAGNAAPQADSKTTSASTTRDEIAGVRYLEHMTGGARPDEKVPMIVVLHAMGGEPAGLLPLFSRYRGRARLILPYGHPYGGMYAWYDSVSEEVPASLVTPEADRLADAIEGLVATRPTVGRPIVTGFSQGAVMTFTLAVTHPNALAAAFPISGLLPPSLYPPAATSSESRVLPPLVIAFHGGADLAVPTRAARASIEALRSAGYVAELRVYPAVEHDISSLEERDLLEELGKAADNRGPSAR